ncbi:MAG: tetratricopeptide repeat protein, partial [Prolixibacteraceae bacterium]
LIVFLLVLSFHPIRFMAANHPYYYLYYNQFVGGLKGAYGEYETDYYYHSMREGAEWLQEYLKNKPNSEELRIGGNFPSQWFFRKDTSLKFVYFPWQDRSKYNWDYAVVANSYIPPFQLKNKIWPPDHTIHTIFADGIPVCAVVERVTKDDLEGLNANKKGDYVNSALLFQKALENDPKNELICYSFAESFMAQGKDREAEQMILKSLELNPDFEKALVLYGDLAIKQKNPGIAAKQYKKAIAANRKYFQAYTKLAKVYAETDVEKARKILSNCLKINPRYIPALQMLADTYRNSEPEKAVNYDEMIKKLK